MRQIDSISRQRGRIFLMVVIAVGALAVGLMISSTLFDRSLELRSARAYPEARPMPQFDLLTSAGEALNRDSFLGQWSLLFFGFTNCPDICPDTLALLSAVLDDLDTTGAAAKPQVVFVSVDPERDDQAALADYVAWFNEDFIAASGSDESLQALTRHLGLIYFLGEPDEDTGFYNVDHSASVLIIDPEARVFGRFAPPLDRQGIVADLFALSR